MQGSALFTPLLLRGYCLAAVIAGIVAQRHLAPGIFLGLVAGALALTRSPFLDVNLQSLRSSLALRYALVCLLLVLCAATGAGYAQFRQFDAQAHAIRVPPWLTAALAEDNPYDSPPQIAVTVKVQQVIPMGNNRLRVLATNAAPSLKYWPTTLAAATAHTPDFFHPYSGTLNIMLHAPRQPIVAGQTLHTPLKLMRVRSLANPGVFDIETYWLDRGVAIRGWAPRPSPGTAAATIVEGQANITDQLRERLRQNFLAALPKPDKTHTGEPLPPSAERALDGTPQALLPALIFGDRSFISQAQTELFQSATLSHSLALSGLHLGYAVAIGYAFASALAFLRPKLLLHIAFPRLGMLCALPLAAFYLWLGQAPVSLLRAGVMLFFAALLLFANRPKILLDSLLAALCALLLYNPTSIFDISLQLSALSMLVICLLLPTFQVLANKIIPHPKKNTQAKPSAQQPESKLRTLARGSVITLLVSGCIQLALLPLLLRTFGVAGFWFPLNLLWLPVLGGLVMPLAFVGLLLCGIGAISIATPVLYAATLPCQWLFALLQWMDNAQILTPQAILRPHWVAAAGFWLVCLSAPPLFLSWYAAQKKHQALAAQGIPPSLNPPALATWRAKQKTTIALACLGCLCLVAPTAYGYYSLAHQPVSLRLLDVSQGQAVLVEWPGGRALVDGGGIGSGSFDVGRMVVAPALTDNRPATVDWVINTHPDYDHLGGLLYILERFTLRQGAGSNGRQPAPQLQAALEKITAQFPKRPYKAWQAGDTIPLAPDLWFEVLWPYTTPDTTNNNDSSLILRLVWQGKGLAVICGDAGKAPLNTLAKLHPEKLKADILVMPHHGSASGRSPEFYAAVQPRLALISCGYKNPWGFPAKAVREALQQAAIPWCTTAEQGQLRVSWGNTPDSFSLVTAR